MKIRKVLVSEGLTGFFVDDKKAIREDAELDGNMFSGIPQTPGFRSIRQPGESVSVMLLLEDGQLACGDCVIASYAGVGGRDSLFYASEVSALITAKVKPWLEGRAIGRFQEMAGALHEIKLNSGRLHAGIRYGVSQALLMAVAKAQKKMMAQVLAEEYGTELSMRPIPIYIQTGDDRFTGADKGIQKRVQVLPHGNFNNVKRAIGYNGELLLEYANWLKNRIARYGGADYFPTIHFDVYGTVGYAFRNNMEQVADYLQKLEQTVRPYSLQIEMPVELASKEAQMEYFANLKKKLRAAGSNIVLVIDEWANTLEEIKEWADAGATDMIQVKTIDVGGLDRIVEAVLYCKAKGVGAYLGGTCNETDISARACVHVAMATKPDQMLAKPGMGVDEGIMTVYNEMQRIIVLAGAE